MRLPAAPLHDGFATDDCSEGESLAHRLGVNGEVGFDPEAPERARYAVAEATRRPRRFDRGFQIGEIP